MNNFTEDHGLGCVDMKPEKTIDQFKITLNHVRPPVWRRVQVPADFTLCKLASVLVTAMGWHGYHRDVILTARKNTCRAVNFVFATYWVANLHVIDKQGLFGGDLNG